MNPNHMMLGGISVTKMTEMQNFLAQSKAINDALLAIVSIYANEENYRNGLDHNLAYNFLEKLSKNGVVTRYETESPKTPESSEPPKTPGGFKPRLV